MEKDKEKVRVIRNENVEPESIEWGSPTKGGKVKIYTDLLDKEKTKQKILCAIECLEFMQKESGK